MKKMPLRATLAGFTLLCAAGTAPAVADDEPPFETRVSYADLDVNTAEGAEELLYRLRIAAKRGCDAGYEREAHERRATRLCIEEAVDAAVARLNKPVVTALHNNGRPDSRRLARRDAPHG